MAFRIQIRRDTSLKWSTNNPVLLQGELGYETDTDCIKIGDGINPWNDLEYLVCETDIFNIFSNGTFLVGATGLNFTGSGVTVTNSGGLATVSITGGAGATGATGATGPQGEAGPTGPAGSGSSITVSGEGILETSGVTGFNFSGAGVTVTSSGDFATVTIPGASAGKVYAFRFDYGGASASGSGSRNNTDISRVVQVTSSPFTSSSTTVVVPTGATDNKIQFTFDNETSPFANVYLIGWDAGNGARYRWAHVDSYQRNLWGGGNNENIMTGLTQSTTSANIGFYSNTDILTQFNDAEWQIDLSQTQTGSTNGNDPSTLADIWGHGYIFFVFPG